MSVIRVATNESPTIPAATVIVPNVRAWRRNNGLYQKVFYALLFKAASETLVELSRNPKYLGAKIGCISVLHTWGQNLMEHPHVHSIVPGGGLSFDGTRWVSSRKKFFIPVKVLSRNFRGKFLAFLKTEFQDGNLKFHGKIEPLSGKLNFQRLVERITNLQDGRITFQWRDYKDDNHTKLMTLDASEFICCMFCPADL